MASICLTRGINIDQSILTVISNVESGNVGDVGNAVLYDLCAGRPQIVSAYVDVHLLNDGVTS